ncbi:MAG TPA: nicotinate-nucleotide--dimethylbenzimidazole phosphoribosyltransferase [Candidatus Defluviicoccus seviourii]|nr:nicotinate-nucleotide--dimethylbenzimidazole phosphoribosyltransferase [Candidatus Defluviicoccus seviourii]
MAYDPTREQPLPRSLDDVRALLASLPAADEAAAAAVAAREAVLTKPTGALGRLEDLTAWLARWQGRPRPSLDRVCALVFAGNHGIAAAGVSAYPAAVTKQMVANFSAGGAAVNQLCARFGVELTVRPIALDQPTRDFTAAAAMDEDAFVEALQIGMAAVERDCDLICLGEMGIANTTAAAALALALFGGVAAAWTGRGTGVDGAALERKRAVVARAVRRHGDQATDGLDLLRRLGGRELAALAGAVLAARLKRVPVLLDGYVVGAAAATLAAVRADALAHCQAAHVSAEPGHRLLLARLKLTPLLDLNLRLGEASGAVLAVGLVRAALACHTGMASFSEAGVSGHSPGA